MRERAVDLMLAAALAMLPLLPTGAQYLGLSTVSWAEAIVIFLFALLLITPNARVGTAPDSTAVMSLTDIGSVMAPFIVAVTGGALIGLARDNVMASSVFLANLRDAPMRLFTPMDQVADPMYALRIWLTLVEGPVVFLQVVVLCRRATDPRRRARSALAGTVVGLALVSGFAVFQYVARFHLHPHWVLADPNLVRANSTFEDPNTLGSYLVLGIGVAVAVVLRERAVRPHGWRVWLTAGSGALAVAALGTTVSRTAWVAAVLAVLLLLAYGPPWDSAAAEARWALSIRRAARGCVALLGILFVVWLGARGWLPGHSDYHPTNPVEAVLETIDPRVPLVDVLKGRRVFWTAALEMARAHPIAGAGLGRYPRLVGDYLGFAAPIENAHNFFLQLLAEIGAVGLFTFLLVLGVIVRALRQAAKARGANAGLIWGLSFGCLSFLLTLFAGHPLLLPSAQLVIGTSLGAGLTATFTLSGGAQQRGRFWSFILVGATAAVAIVYGVAVSQARWEDSADPYGYTWGLYGREHDQAKSPFRWTGREAMLYVPPGGARVVTLDFSAFPPQGGAPTTVTLSAVGQRTSVVCRDNSWHRVSFDIDRATAHLRGVEIRFDVDRVVVPATVGGSNDVRELGVMIQPPKFFPPREERER